jgi:superfamily I DNA/RNA helicase
VNYRTSEQIRRTADRLLDPESTDIDGETERRDAVSVFSGPAPEVWVKASQDEEARAVGQWLRAHLDEGLQPHECAVVVRSEAQLPRAQQAAESAGCTARVLDERVATHSGAVSICTMHLAKGLEFRAVAVMACDDDVLPLQERIEAVGDTGDLAETYNSERQLLYVACTRARDHLLVTATAPGSEFLDDLQRRQQDA